MCFKDSWEIPNYTTPKDYINRRSNGQGRGPLSPYSWRGGAFHPHCFHGFLTFDPPTKVVKVRGSNHPKYPLRESKRGSVSLRGQFDVGFGRSSPELALARAGRVMNGGAMAWLRYSTDRRQYLFRDGELPPRLKRKSHKRIVLAVSTEHQSTLTFRTILPSLRDGLYASPCP
jgi:hypothetical protein